MSTKTTDIYEIEIFKLGALKWFTRVYRVEPNPFADDLKNLVWNIPSGWRARSQPTHP